MKSIPLTRGYEAIVSDEDFEELSKFKWNAHVNRCRRVEPCRHVKAVKNSKSKRGYKSISMTMAQHLMGTKKDHTIDHANGNTLDNRRENLRWATTAQQSQNRQKPNRLGYKGIMANGNGFAARITVDGKRQFLGNYDSAVAAAAAYDAAARLHFGQFARVNFQT